MSEMKWEQRVRALEEEGLTRSDAQAVADAEETKEQVKHTPGPWHERTVTIIQFEDDITHNEECLELANVNTDETVCYVPIAADGVHQENGEANARLIAAAPDGYKFAEHILAMADDAYLTGHAEWQEIVAEARAFHAKAEGR